MRRWVLWGRQREPEITARPAATPAAPALSVTAALPPPQPGHQPAPAPHAGATGTNGAVTPDGGPWPQICDRFAMQLLLRAEQLRTMLDRLEADEDDPRRLDQLYEIDHGVTQMRRASLGLRELAGRGGEPLDGPVTSLLDVIRMAASAIERYGQVRPMKVAELAIVGYAADDVGLLLSALLENATHLSPGTVTVSAHLLDDGAVMFRIEDAGIGMTPDQVAAVNEALAGPVPDVDETAARHTGFPVVHRVASRHGIKVRLAQRPAPLTGILAMVTVPPHLVCEVPEDEEDARAAGTRAGSPLMAARWAAGPREADETAGSAGWPAKPASPGELPRRESVSLRGRHGRAAATAAAPPGEAAAARRAFADALGAFTTAVSRDSGTEGTEGTEGQDGTPAGEDMPSDEGSGQPGSEPGTQEGTV